MSVVSNINPYPHSFETLCYEYSNEPCNQVKLKIASSHSPETFLNEVTKLNHLKFARTKRGKYSIQDIFKDYFDGFSKKYENRLKRTAIFTNVHKMIGCGSFSNGYIFYECSNCDNFHVIGLTCKSRFCPSCGKKYRDARAMQIADKCIAVPHRHIVFTIASELREIFQRNRHFLHLLFSAVDSTLKYMIQSKSKKAVKRGDTLGYILTLHTFGNALTFNPHIHCIIAESVIDKSYKSKRFHFFNYPSLRKSFMKSLLDLMWLNTKDDEKKSFKKVIHQLYRNHKDGFYVYAPKLIQQNTMKGSNKIKSLVEYVARYAGHPPIAESRIIHVNHEKETITYSYEPHEDDNSEVKKGTQYVTEHIYDFIGKLIVHIPDEGFHNIRYYGFYSNKTIIDPTKSSHKLFPKSYFTNLKKLMVWRFRILNSYHYDPIKCTCGHEMTINYKLSHIPKSRGGTDDG